MLTNRGKLTSVSKMPHKMMKPQQPKKSCHFSLCTAVSGRAAETTWYNLPHDQVTELGLSFQPFCSTSEIFSFHKPFHSFCTLVSSVYTLSSAATHPCFCLRVPCGSQHCSVMQSSLHGVDEIQWQDFKSLSLWWCFSSLLGSLQCARYRRGRW